MHESILHWFIIGTETSHTMETSHNTVKLAQLSYDNQLNTMLPNLYSSVSDQTEGSFRATHWTFNFENVAKHARSNVLSFCRNLATGTFLQWAWVANGLNKWEHLVLFLQMSCQGKHIFYCLVSTSSPSSRVLTAVPKLWFAFQCQSGNNVVEILDVPWSAAWTSLPVYWSPYLLDWPGHLPQGNKAFPCPTEHFPGLSSSHSVCPFWFRVTVAHLNKNLCCSTSFICSFQNATSMPACSAVESILPLTPQRPGFARVMNIR